MCVYESTQASPAPMAKEDAEHVDQAEHKFAAAALMQLFAASLADPVPSALGKSTKMASSRSTHSAAESDARRGGRKRKPSAKLADNAYSSDDTMTSEPVRKAQRMQSHAEHKCGVRDDTAAVKDESDSVKSECATPAVSSPLHSPSAAPSYNKYCHFCQHVKVKRTSSMFGCSNQECQRRYCEYCLRIHLNDPAPTDALSSAGWLCPHCRASCCCSTLVCDKPHRHCKAYRYRLLRAQQAAQRSANAAAAKPVLATVRKGASPKKVVKSDECSVGPAGVLPEEERSCGLAGDMTAAPSPEPRSQ